MKFHVVDIDGFQIKNPEWIRLDRHFFIDSILSGKNDEGRVEESLVSVDAYAGGKIVVRCFFELFVRRRSREQSGCIDVARKIILNQSDD